MLSIITNMAFPLYLIIGWIRVVGKLLDPRMLHWLNQLNKPLVPLLAIDLEGMLDKMVMDKLLMVAVHKLDQLDQWMKL